MPFYEPDVVAEAKKLDLLTYLQNYEPQELVHVSGNVYCTKTHDSLRISNGKWCWFSQGVGGKSVLDYLIKVNGYSFLEAMERIVGQAAAKPPAPVYSEIKEKPKTLLLPEKYRYAEYAASYLEKRGISWELISYCISTGQLYESNPYHNVVFVGFDKQGKARFACQPKKVIEESKLPAALTQYLEDYPHIKTVALHLDNDGPGRLAAKAIKAVLPKEYEVKNRPPPWGKDVNDYLCHRLGIPMQKPKEKAKER